MKVPKILKEYGGSNQSLENDQGLKKSLIEFCNFEFNGFGKFPHFGLYPVKILCLVLSNG